MVKTARFYTLRGATGEIRTAQFEGRDHVVVPVVALVEGVLHAMNSPAPELVLAEEFSIAPAGWNGRPLVPDHPIRDGVPVSANSVEVLETECIGRIFNAYVKGKRLLMEAWIDVERAKTTEKGVSILERIEKSEMIEVSVGVYTNTEDKPGNYNGVKYAAIWRNIVPDHLALLSEGTLGACSNAMGCGTPRAASAGVHTVLDESITIMSLHKTKSIRDRIMSLFGVAPTDAMTSQDLHSRLWDALYASEPAFLGIDSLELDEKVVIYAVAPNDIVSIFRRTYDVAEDGSVTISEDREEVKPVTTWVPVNATASAPKAACGCGGGQPIPQPAVKSTSQENIMTKEQRIAALLASKKNAFARETHGAFLETLTDDQLTALEAADAAATEPAPPAPAAPPAPTAPSAPVSAEAYIAAAPAEVREVLQRGLAAAKQQKQAVIAKIKTSQRNPFTDAQLESKSLEELTQLASFAGVELEAAPIDFSGQGAPRSAASVKETEEGPAEPMSVADALRAAGRIQ